MYKFILYSDGFTETKLTIFSDYRSS